MLAAGTVAGSTPLPAVVSARFGSPAAAKLTVTVSFHQSSDMFDAGVMSYSGARSAAAVGAFGAVLSMLMLPTVTDEVLPALSNTAPVKDWLRPSFGKA